MVLEFDCPHCGSHIRLPQRYARQEGWCRVCKGPIIAPDADGAFTLDYPALSDSERLKFTASVLRIAATKAEKSRAMARQYRERFEQRREEHSHEVERLTDELAAARLAVEEMESLCEQLEAQLAQQQEELVAARDDARDLETTLRETASRPGVPHADYLAARQELQETRIRLSRTQQALEREEENHARLVAKCRTAILEADELRKSTLPRDHLLNRLTTWTERLNPEQSEEELREAVREFTAELLAIPEQVSDDISEVQPPKSEVDQSSQADPLEEELLHARQQLDALQSAHDALKFDLERMRADKDTAAKKAQEAHTGMLAFQEQVRRADDLEAALTRAKDEQLRLSEDLDNLQLELKATRQAHWDAKEALDSLQADYKTLQDRLDAYDSEGNGEEEDALDLDLAFGQDTGADDSLMDTYLRFLGSEEA